MFKFVSSLFLLTVLVGCDSPSDNKDLPYIENDVSILQGVYGQVASYPDYLPNNGPSADEGFEIDVYYGRPNFEVNNRDTPFLSALTNHKGFYEIPLQAGTYCMCALMDCRKVEIASGSKERLDYSLSLIGSWSKGSLECKEL